MRTSLQVSFKGTRIEIKNLLIVNDDWAHSDVSGQVLENQRTTIGLWKQCVEVGTGLDSCDHYDNLLLGADAAESEYKIKDSQIYRKF